MGYRIVVVGATGNVGREILNVLAEILDSLVLLFVEFHSWNVASNRAIGY